MICEYCNKVHGGIYGSGRFCSNKCARGFSTRDKRKEINKRVSLKLRKLSRVDRICEYCSIKYNKRYGSGRFCSKKCATSFASYYAIGKNHNHTFNSADILTRIEIQKIKRKHRLANCCFDDLNRLEKRDKVFEEQKGRCNKCGINNWMDSKITLEFHHKDGDKGNGKRNNVELLCPNCHSQTNNYRRLNGHKRINN
jgi:5-methylcytosine-specific restriction endonuclease McrA